MTKPEQVVLAACAVLSAAGAGARAAARKQRYTTAVLDAVGSASNQAAQGMRPALISFSAGPSYVNINRNTPTPDGWGLGPNNSEPSDKSLAVIKVEGVDRQPIAVLLNYAVRSAVFEPARETQGSNGNAITTDLGGATARAVETIYGDGVVAMFLTGAAGDQVPVFAARRNVPDKEGNPSVVDLGAQGFTLLDPESERLGGVPVELSTIIGR